MLKELVRDEKQADAVRGCQWRNLLFMKDGTTGYAKKMWPTQSEAKSRHELQLARLMAGEIVMENANGTITTKDNYSWCMQIPVMEGQ